MFKATVHSRNARRESSLVYQPRRRPEWNGLSAQEILARHVPGKSPPLKVLELLINLFNNQHTARYKEVSFKTRQERAQFLRRFFLDLRQKAGFKTLPDPRNLGTRHIKAMVAVWQQQKLAPGTLQTYLSFLRGFAQWIGKAGLIRQPQYYGLKPEEYERHQVAQYDKSWSAHGIDISALIASICQYDRYVGAELRLMRDLRLRKKEAIMFRPHECVVPFEAIGLSPHKKKSDFYARIKPGSKGGRERFVALDTPEKLAVIEHVKSVVLSRDGHLGDPSRSLKQNMTRFDNVMKKFGVTQKKLGVTSHGLRHEGLINDYEKLTGEAPPVRGGAPLPREIDRPARQEVAETAGHSRTRAASSYLGSVRGRQPKPDSGAISEA
jgi:integrase